MKKTGTILASILLFTGISLATSLQTPAAQTTQQKPKTDKKIVKKADKKEVKKVPARKTVTQKPASGKSGNNNSTTAPANTK